jgi:hypothetical protein
MICTDLPARCAESDRKIAWWLLRATQNVFARLQNHPARALRFFELAIDANSVESITKSDVFGMCERVKGTTALPQPIARKRPQHQRLNTVRRSRASTAAQTLR